MPSCAHTERDAELNTVANKTLFSPVRILFFLFILYITIESFINSILDYSQYWFSKPRLPVSDTDTSYLQTHGAEQFYAHI